VKRRVQNLVRSSGGLARAVRGDAPRNRSAADVTKARCRSGRRGSAGWASALSSGRCRRALSEVSNTSATSPISWTPRGSERRARNGVRPARSVGMARCQTCRSWWMPRGREGARRTGPWARCQRFRRGRCAGNSAKPEESVREEGVRHFVMGTARVLKRLPRQFGTSGRAKRPRSESFPTRAREGCQTPRHEPTRWCGPSTRARLRGGTEPRPEPRCPEPRCQTSRSGHSPGARKVARAVLELGRTKRPRTNRPRDVSPRWVTPR
jgi:hypothetical protein